MGADKDVDDNRKCKITEDHMSLTINNNSVAFNTWTSFAANSKDVARSMGHLSTGVKMVADDPSGVGISERMRSQSRNVAMGRANVDNGLSLLQTVDSWLQKMNDMLGRMSELTIESGDGTKSVGDKDNIQTEFKQLQTEMVRITSHNDSAAKFNGLYLFRGGNGVVNVSNSDTNPTGKVSLQIGPDLGQKIDLDLKDLQVASAEVMGSVHTYNYSTDNVTLTASTHTGVTWGSIINDTKFSVRSSDSIGKLAKAIDFISNARASNGAQQNRLEYTRSALLSYEDNLRAAESKIRDIDMAAESTKLAKYQILGQVGNAMLAQANQLPQAVVQLIG